MKDKEKQIEEIEKFSFRVIDNKTGKEADTYKIALKEDWAKGLMYCDMEGFAINEEGSLVLLDECGNIAYCPCGRFTVIPEGSVVLNSEQYSNYLITQTNNEFLKEQAEKLKADNERLYKNIGKFKDIVSKETAEKILKAVLEDVGEFYAGDIVEELAKQFGVDLKGEE